MQLEPYLEGDNRIVLPLGSTEQTCRLSASAQEPPRRFLEQRE